MPPEPSLPWDLSSLTPQAPLSLTALLIALAVGVVLALLLRLHFYRYGSTLSNREEFAQVFPFILLTTILIITVVKSSLALSLGLVGALSIVRFRTPIKEPEELAYLFLAIAMGLGLGANQVIPTIVASIVILAFMAIIGTFRARLGGKNTYLSVEWRNSKDQGPEPCLNRLNDIVFKHTNRSDLRRFDVRTDLLEATYFLDVADTRNLAALAGELEQQFDGAAITFLDQNQLPSV